jgi:hypothetical protein
VGLPPEIASAFLQPWPLWPSTELSVMLAVVSLAGLPCRLLQSYFRPRTSWPTSSSANTMAAPNTPPPTRSVTHSNARRQGVRTSDGGGRAGARWHGAWWGRICSSFLVSACPPV